MPYIQQEQRDRLNAPLTLLEPRTLGELNYCITQLCRDYFARCGGGYSGINSIMGVLSCVGHEFYRRIARPYEDQKIAVNGDVY
jgi:hypothetical protein